VLLTSSYPFDPRCDEAELEAAIKACQCVLCLRPAPAFSPECSYRNQPTSLPMRFSRCRCSYDRRRLDSASDAARTLVFGLLELDPSQRLTAAQALQHAFITQLDDAQAKATPRRMSVLEKLQRTVTVIRGYQVPFFHLPNPHLAAVTPCLQRVLRCFGQDTIGPLRRQLSAGSQQRLQASSSTRHSAPHNHYIFTIYPLHTRHLLTNSPAA
jgi:serine/threonine protein kinase